MGRSNPWGDLDQMSLMGRYPGRNHVCNISRLSVKGCGCGERGKFAFSHWLHASPLQHWSHYRVTVWSIPVTVSAACHLDNVLKLCTPAVQWIFYSHFIDHRLRGSASTVLTATGQVNGRWRILTRHRIETHESTATKFRTIDYVRERTP